MGYRTVEILSPLAPDEVQRRVEALFPGERTGFARGLIESSEPESWLEGGSRVRLALRIAIRFNVDVGRP